MTPPVLFQAVDSGKMHIILRPSELFPYQGSGLSMLTARLNTPEGDEAARRLVRAIVQSTKRVHEDKQYAMEVLAKHVSGTTPDIASRTWDWTIPNMPEDAYPTKQGLQFVIDDLKDLFNGKPVPTAEGLLALKYLDEASGKR